MGASRRRGSVVLATVLLAALTFPAWRELPRARLGAGVAILVVGSMTVGLVTWAVKAPLSEQRAVALPPLKRDPADGGTELCRGRGRT